MLAHTWVTRVAEFVGAGIHAATPFPVAASGHELESWSRLTLWKGKGYTLLSAPLSTSVFSQECLSKAGYNQHILVLGHWHECFKTAEPPSGRGNNWRHCGSIINHSTNKRQLDYEAVGKRSAKNQELPFFIKINEVTNKAGLFSKGKKGFVITSHTSYTVLFCYRPLKLLTRKGPLPHFTGKETEA